MLGAGNATGTLVNALLGRGQTLSRGGDALRPGIVHRLDKETSGVILVAKNDVAHAKIWRSVSPTHGEENLHCAGARIVEANQGRIELAIGRDPSASAHGRGENRGAPRTCDQCAREARTDWRALPQWMPRRSSKCSCTPGVRIRFACIFPRLSIRWWETRSTAQRRSCVVPKASRCV